MMLHSGDRVCDWLRSRHVCQCVTSSRLPLSRHDVPPCCVSMPCRRIMPSYCPAFCLLSLSTNVWPGSQVGSVSANFVTSRGCPSCKCLIGTTATGTVTLGGQPLADAVVSFTDSKGNVYSTTTLGDGTYSVDVAVSAVGY